MDSGKTFHLPASFISLLLLIASLTLSGCNENKSGAADNSNIQPAPPPVTGGPTGTTNGKPAIPQIALVKVAAGFKAPTNIANAGDGSNRIFIVEQAGVVKIIKNGSVLTAPFLDITEKVRSGGEQGLFVVVFPPGPGPGKDHFYVNYTNRRGVGDTVISRFDVNAGSDSADPNSEQQLLTITQPFPNHNGGQMAFGPDRYLYIGTGDGGSGGDPDNNAQNTGSLLGKMLRLDVESSPGAGYAVPETNPFNGISGYRPEIWALGLRNPWRFSFDRQTGDLYIADVGQGGYEEIDLQPAASKGGENYGWDKMEGRHCYNASSCDANGLTLPVAEYKTHADGNCSVTGGFVYRGNEFPALQGVYLYGDYCSGRIWGLRQTGGVWENKLVLDTDLSISTFGEDEAGNMYVADHSKGDIYKIAVGSQ